MKGSHCIRKTTSGLSDLHRCCACSYDLLSHGLTFIETIPASHLYDCLTYNSLFATSFGPMPRQQPPCNVPCTVYESPTYIFSICPNNHCTCLRRTPEAYNACFLYTCSTQSNNTRNIGKSRDITSLQADGTANFVNVFIFSLEAACSKKFVRKLAQFLA